MAAAWDAGLSGVLGILGPGALGRSLAQWAAECGLPVRLLGRDLGHAEEGHQRILRLWARALERGTLAPDDHLKAQSFLQAAAFSAEGMRGVTAFLEAMPEIPGPKQAALAQAAAWGGNGLLMMTGTSALPVGALAGSAGIPERLLGFHLFVPVPRMAVVELIVPAGTDPAWVDLAKELAATLGKQAVLVQDQAGFAAARMALAQGLEAMRLLEAGVASADGLDALMTLGYGHPVGPLELSDRIGLDLRLQIAEGLFQATGDPRYAPPAVLRRKVAAGELGRKTGIGFHHWDSQGRRR